MPYMIMQKRIGTGTGDPYLSDVLVYLKIDAADRDGNQEGTCEIGGGYTQFLYTQSEGQYAITNVELPTISIPSNSPFTVDFKFYTPASGDCGWGNNSNHYAFNNLSSYLSLGYAFSGPDIVYMCGASGGRHNMTCGSSGQWNHFALVREMDGNVYRYINGVKNTTSMGQALCSITGSFKFGGGLMMDYIRITKVARWTTDFNPNGILYPS